MADIVTVAEAKSQLNKGGTVDDDELALYVAAVNEPVARYIGYATPTAAEDTFDGGSHDLLLTRRPVLSVESVTVDGAALAADTYTVDKLAGVLPSLRGCFAAGTQNVVVAYTAGRTEVPPHAKLAALIIIQHLWETQRGRDSRRLPRGEEDVVQFAGFGFAIPNRAAQLLGSPTPGIA